MKSIKLLAALAIPAMFAACTNEEIAMESTQQLNQVVGAELIGTDISINVSNGVGSRLNAEGWQSTDKLGLAWIVNGEYSTAQSIETAPDNSKWYANHMFAVEDGKFVTKGNAYKGWHFAYFPFSYTESVSEKEFNINPAQTSKEWLGGRINDALHISPLKFLTRESLDENYQLKEDVAFEVQRAVNAIQVTTTATEGFAEGGALADLGVNSIKLNVGEKVFANTVKMNVKNLPLDTAKVAISKDSLYQHLWKLGKNDRVMNSTDRNTITTDVEGAGFVVSDETKLITITRPVNKGFTLDSTQISIVVAVDGGLFEIEYVEDAEEGSNAAINNAAIIALKKAYAEGGTMTKVGGLLGLNVVLYPEIFDTDFEHITDLEEWNAAVALATKLGRTSETFKVDSIIDFNGEIAMPEGCALTVKAADVEKGTPTLNIKKSIESWPAGLTSEIAVVNHKTISNATGINGSSILNKGNMKAVADTIACLVVNEGTITLKALAKLNSVDNANGRINVAYGSYVTLTPSTEAGVIAYTIASSEKAYKLNNLMGVTTGQSYYANVNTFVVKSGRTLDLNLTDAAGVGSNDAYYPTTGAQATPLASLANINIELNEGILVADANSGLSVKNVEVVGGENNEIKNVNIVEGLTVTKGKVTVDAEAVNDYKTAATIANIDVKKDAELISNVNVYVENIANPSGAKTTVTEPYTIWYTKVYTQGGSATGSILKASWDGVADQVVPTKEGHLIVYTVNKADELVWLSQQGQLKNTKVVLGGNINMAGVNWTKGINFGAGDFASHLDGNGFAIMNLNGNSGLLSYAVGSIKNLTIEGVNIASNDFIGALANNSYALIEDVTVKNVTVKGTKRVGAIVGIHNGGNMKNCNVENASISGDCYSAGVITGMVNESAGQKFESCTIKNSTVDAELKGAIAGIINGVTLTVQNITVENTTPSELVGKLYNGGKLVEVK